MENSKMNTKLGVLTMCQIALCVAFMCVAAFISIPIPISTVPITLQTFIVIFTALLLKPQYSFITLAIYTLLGIVGLPVFSGGTAGIGRILAPGGGFIIGFVAAAFLVSLLKGKKQNIVRYIVVAIVVGIPVVDIFGVIFYMIFAGADFLSALALMVIPYIVGDIVKCVVAALAAVAVQKALHAAKLDIVS